MYLTFSRYRNPAPGEPTRRAAMYQRACKAYCAHFSPMEWKNSENFHLMDKKLQREVEAIVAYVWER